MKWFISAVLYGVKYRVQLKPNQAKETMWCKQMSETVEEQYAGS